MSSPLALDWSPRQPATLQNPFNSAQRTSAPPPSRIRYLAKVMLDEIVKVSIYCLGDLTNVPLLLEVVGRLMVM